MSDDPRAAFRPSNAPIDPVAMARRDLAKALPRRFYRDVSVAETEGGFGVTLDGKQARTPAKALLAAPTRELAKAIAAEWAAQTDLIAPDTMPLTRLANAAIDGVAHHLGATIAEVAKFAETDLVCYRASDPDTLVAAQAAAWDPILVFAREVLGARFICSGAVMYVEQPKAALGAVRAAVETLADGPAGVWRLAACSVMTSLSGSVLIALAVARGVTTPEAGWLAANVDEDYQMRFWGTHEAALARRASRWKDMEAAAALYGLSA